MDAPVIYAGQEEPSILNKHYLEYFLTAGALTLLLLGAWMTWWGWAGRCVRWRRSASGCRRSR
ncbi:hypothetical protein ACFQX6_46940 [Streptosporangium lutulentum]